MVLNVVRWVARSPFVIRVIAFISLLAVAWATLAIPIALLMAEPTDRDIAFLGWLLVAFLLSLACWSRWFYQQPFGFSVYGLNFNRQNYTAFLSGWTIGSVSLAALFWVEGVVGWLSWHVMEKMSLGQLMAIAFEGAVVAIAVSLGEELLFRGWLLNELHQDYRPEVCLWVSSLLYAAAHFIKPLEEIIRTSPQFPGLVLLGLILVWARRARQGQLGLPIGLHGGLVWGYYLIQVGQLATIHPDAPELWVGIDQNPLAGGLGLISLMGIAIWIRWFEFFKPPEKI